MAAPVVYRSTDGSAPTLSGTAGDLVNLLDKCLVTGYGAKAAAGWTKPFTGTNAAVFRAGGGNRFYLDVNDNSPGAAAAQEARMRGYETMSAVGTGTGPFPTVAQLASGIVLRKSAAAGATTRSWVVVADDRTVYVFVITGDVAGMYLGFMFGDVFSYLAGDPYRTAIIGRSVENSATTSSTAAEFLAGLSVAKAAQSGHYLARSYTGFAGAITALQYGDSSVNSTFLAGNITFPNPVDGGLYISPIFVAESASTVRGQLRGLWHQLHLATSFADGDTFDSPDGRSFLFLKSSGSTGIWTVETSDTWDTTV